MSEPRRREPWEINPDGPPVSDIPGDRSVFDRPRRDPWDIVPTPLHTELKDEERPLGTSEFERRHPNRMDRIRGGLRNIGQGVPIFGSLLETTPASRDFGRTYPLTSGLGRFGLGAVAYTPGAYAARGATNVAANLARRYLGGGGQRTHAGVFADTLGQGILGGGVAAADATIDANRRGEHIGGNSLLGNAALGFGTGVAGNLGSRLLAPSGVGNRFRRDRSTGHIIPDIEHAPILDAMSRNPEFRGLLERYRTGTLARVLGLPLPPGYRVPTESQVIRHMNRFRGAQLAEQTAERLGSNLSRALSAGVGAHLGGIPGGILGFGGNEAVRGAVRAYGRTNIGRRHLGNQFSPLTQSAVNASALSGLHNSSEFTDYNPELLNILGGQR